MEYFYQKITSPIGDLYVVSNASSLVAIHFAKSWKEEKENYVQIKMSNTPLLKKTQKQLSEYFSGKRTEFDLPVAPEGTDFQKSAWKTLQKIPFGKTWSYLEQATKMGKPKAIRAVGGANGRNPIPIVIPCHRVIGKNGTLTGYAGGLSIKEQLLKIEAVSF